MTVAVVGLVITGVWNVMTNVRVRFPVPPALLEEIVMLLLVAVVGFPEISTVEATKLSRSPPLFLVESNHRGIKR